MSVEVGAKYKGKITGITKFGAFVDLGEKQNGLVHISEVSNDYVNDIHDVLSIGDEVTVKVLSISEDGKVALSIRHCLEPKKETTPAKKDAMKKKAPMNKRKKQVDFESLMSDFLKTSEENLSSLRRNTEGKRGGRGGRRS